MYDQMSPIDSLALDFGFILPIAVFVGIMLFIVKRKYERGKIKIAMHEAQLKEKMISLKHQALNAQMNPHFINNLLLHIYVALEKGNQKNSLSDLGNFSQLVSLVLKSTKSDFISLDDELKIADYYFKLQQSRFEHKFQYSIQNKNLNDEDLELIKVPPMILQPIIENAIEHGIRTQNAKGIIALQLSEDKEYLHCEIIDNGIGYSKSKAIQKKYHSGISLKNIEERLQIMDAKNSKTKLIKIEDKLNTNQEIVGTKVTLKVPLVA
jgi:sensor histidine kinase YesM